MKKCYNFVQTLTQSECYKQNVIELNKMTPDEELLKLLKYRINKFDEENKQKEPIVFNGSFGKSEPMQDCKAIN